MTSAPPPPARAGVRNVVDVLRHRNYRLLWFGTLFSNTGDWMDQVALNFLVIQTTGSAVALGLVNLARAVPILALTLLGGVAADRFERRRLMMASQALGLVLAVILAVIVAMDAADLWLILIVAAGRGAMVAFNQPARHSLVSELVPRASLSSAIALNSLTFNLTKVAGPLLAGVMIAYLGVAACFALNAISFLVVLWMLSRMRFPPRPPAAPKAEPVGRALVAGLVYLSQNRTVGLLVLVALIPPFFGQPYLQLLALFAVEVFRVGPQGLGLMTAAAATGAMCGALFLALVPGAGRRGIVMLWVMAAYGTAVAAFAVTGAFRPAILLLAAAGAAQIVCNASNNILLQMIVPDEVRGRVLSVLLLNKGMVQLGTAAVAMLAGLIGAQAALFASGAVVLIAACAIMILFPSIRRLRT